MLRAFDQVGLHSAGFCSSNEQGLSLTLKVGEPEVECVWTLGSDRNFQSCIVCIRLHFLIGKLR